MVLERLLGIMKKTPKFLIEEVLDPARLGIYPALYYVCDKSVNVTDNICSMIEYDASPRSIALYVGREVLSGSISAFGVCVAGIFAGAGIQYFYLRFSEDMKFQKSTWKSLRSEEYPVEFSNRGKVELWASLKDGLNYPAFVRMLVGRSSKEVSDFNTALSYKGEDHALVVSQSFFDFMSRPSQAISLKHYLSYSVNALSPYVNPPSSFMHFFDSAVKNIVLGDSQKAYCFSLLGRSMSDHLQKDRPEAYAFHAMISSVLNHPDRDRFWHEALDLSLEAPVWERVGESRNVVRVLRNSDFLNQSLLFKESPDRSSLEREIESTFVMRDVLDGRAASPYPLFLSDSPNEEGRYTYVMNYLKGDVLYDLLAERKKAPVNSIVDVLSRIHFGYPESKVQGGRISLKDKLETAVFDTLTVPEPVKYDLFHSLDPVLDYFSSELNSWKRNCDLHSGNVIVQANQIGIVDCEDLGLAPVQMDLANLLEFGDYFSGKQKRKYIRRYFDCLSPDFEFDWFAYGYCMAAIFRLIRFGGAGESMESMHPRLPYFFSRVAELAVVARTDFAFSDDVDDKLGGLASAASECAQFYERRLVS